MGGTAIRLVPSGRSPGSAADMGAATVTRLRAPKERPDAERRPSQTPHRPDRTRTGRPPALPGDRDLLRAPEPRPLGKTLPDAVGRGGPARAEDHRFPGRQRGRLRPARAEGHLDEIRLARRGGPASRWSPSGPSPGSSTMRPRSRSPPATTAGSSSCSGSSPNRSRRRPSSSALVDLIESGINLFQAEAQLDAFE